MVKKSVTFTKTVRIDIAKAKQFDTEIIDTCNGMYLNGFRLASTFVHLDQLVLIFQVAADSAADQ